MSFLSEKLSDIHFTKSVMIMVDPFLLHPDPENDLIYGEFDPEKNENQKLIEEIQEMGLLQPLLVRRHPVLPEEYIIVSGHRRYHAAKAAGLTRVEVLVMNTNTPEEKALAKLAITVSNHSRDRSSPALMAREMGHLETALKELRKVSPDKFKGKELRNIIAEELGVSPKTIARTKKILNHADEKTKHEYITGKITQIEAIRRVDVPSAKRVTPVITNFEEPLPGQISMEVKTPMKNHNHEHSIRGTSVINQLVRITERLELAPEIAADLEISRIIADLENILTQKENIRH